MLKNRMTPSFHATLPLPARVATNGSCMLDEYDTILTPPVFHHPLLQGIPALHSFTTFYNARPTIPSTSIASTICPLSPVMDMADPPVSAASGVHVALLQVNLGQ